MEDGTRETPASAAGAGTRGLLAVGAVGSAGLALGWALVALTAIVTALAEPPRWEGEVGVVAIPAWVSIAPPLALVGGLLQSAGFLGLRRCHGGLQGGAALFLLVAFAALTVVVVLPVSARAALHRAGLADALRVGPFVVFAATMFVPGAALLACGRRAVGGRAALVVAGGALVLAGAAFLAWGAAQFTDAAVGWGGHVPAGYVLVAAALVGQAATAVALVQQRRRPRAAGEAG